MPMKLAKDRRGYFWRTAERYPSWRNTQIYEEPVSPWTRDILTNLDDYELARDRGELDNYFQDYTSWKRSTQCPKVVGFGSGSGQVVGNERGRGGNVITSSLLHTGLPSSSSNPLNPNYPPNPSNPNYRQNSVNPNYPQNPSNPNYPQKPIYGRDIPNNSFVQSAPNVPTSMVMPSSNSYADQQYLSSSKTPLPYSSSHEIQNLVGVPQSFANTHNPNQIHFTLFDSIMNYGTKILNKLKADAAANIPYRPYQFDVPNVVRQNTELLRLLREAIEPALSSEKIIRETSQQQQHNQEPRGEDGEKEQIVAEDGDKMSIDADHPEAISFHKEQIVEEAGEKIQIVGEAGEKIQIVGEAGEKENIVGEAGDQEEKIVGNNWEKEHLMEYEY